MYAAVEAAIRDGVLEGEPDIVAHLLWSGVHGIVALHLSGMLELGRNLEEFVEAFIDRELGRSATSFISGTASRGSSRSSKIVSLESRE